MPFTLAIWMTLGGFAQPPRQPYPAFTGTEFAFTEAQEQWVRGATKVNRLEAVLEPFDARLVRMLGCAQHDCREVATDLIGAQGMDAARALIWGTMHRDAEVQSRCRMLINRLVCQGCNGTGLCPTCMGTGTDLENETPWCWTGHRKYHGNYSDNSFTCACPHCNGTGKPGFEVEQ